MEKLTQAGPQQLTARTGLSMRNILFYYSSQQVHTGSPRVLMRLVEGLDRSCFVPYFLAGHEGNLSTELEKRGTELVRGVTGQIARNTLHRNLGNILSLMHLLRKHRIDLVHINELGWNSELALAAWLRRIPVIFHIHNPEQMNSRNINCRIGSKYLYVSQALRNQCNASSVVGEKAVVVYNPINVEQFSSGKILRDDLGIKEGNFVIGTVAQICQRKGIDIIIETAKEVIASFPHVVFLIAGPDAAGEEQYASELRRAVSDQGLAGKIRFLGTRDDIPNFMASLDMFFLPTRSEPFGMVIVEAMASKKPVVTSNVGGIPEIIPDESYGVTSDVANNDFANVIRELLNDPNRLKSVAEKGHERAVALFNDKVFNAAINGTYSSVLQHRGR